MEEAITRYEQAESTYKQASQHIGSAFLENQYAERRKRVMADHAALLRQMGRTAEAESLDKEAAAIVTKPGLRDE